MTQIVSANMTKKRNGHGDIALTLAKKKRTSYFVLWPHVRPWRFSQPQPMLRSIANVESVAQQLGRVAENELQLSESHSIDNTSRAMANPSHAMTNTTHAIANATLPIHEVTDAMRPELNKELGAS